MRSCLDAPLVQIVCDKDEVVDWCIVLVEIPHLLSSLRDFLPYLNLLCHSKTDARFMQDGRKAVWSIPYVSVAFFSSLKQNFIAYHSSKVSDCIFEIHQLWQSGFSWVYSNCCCGCWFEPKIIKIGQSSHKMYCNNLLNFQESTTIFNDRTKKVRKLIVCTSYICQGIHVKQLENFKERTRILKNSDIFLWKKNVGFFFIGYTFINLIVLILIDLPVIMRIMHLWLVSFV